MKLLLVLTLILILFGGIYNNLILASDNYKLIDTLAARVVALEDLLCTASPDTCGL